MVREKRLKTKKEQNRMIFSLVCPSRYCIKTPMFSSHQWIYTPLICLILSWIHSFGTHDILWQRCWINMISEYLFRFCKHKPNSNIGLNHDCATSALVYLNGSFSCSVSFGVWHFCWTGAAWSSAFCSAVCELAGFSTEFG